MQARPARYRLAAGLLALAVSLASGALAAPPGAPIVATQDGMVQGASEGDVIVFRGIPYAAPPVGDLRWRPPLPPARWSGTRMATAFAPDCPGEFPDRARMAEDCLYLNLWTKGIDPAAKRPVMVWIYGGGYRGGSAAMPQFDGSALARKDVVLVSFGFRTNSLGFLALPELTAESGHGSSGNYGLLDAVAALCWVKQNIARFGGDPDNVTVFGQSSGSETVNILTASPLAKGLFQRAIGESGSSFGTRRALPLAQVEQAGTSFMHQHGATSLAQLRKLPFDQLLLLGDAPKIEPNIDGWVIPQDVRAIYEAGKQNDVAMLIGNNSSEFGRPPALTAAQLRADLDKEYGPLAGQMATLLGDRDPTDARWWLTRIEWGDYPAATWSRLQTATGHAPAYRYLFDYAPPQGEGRPRLAHHGAELPYIFGTYRHPGGPAMGPADDHMAELLSSYWTNFARSGDPNGPGLPKWTPQDQAPDRLMRFDEAGAAPAAERDPALIQAIDRHYYGIEDTHLGTVAGGARWAVQVPAQWNGVLVTFGNPRAAIDQGLLARGYAVGKMIQSPGIGLRPRQWANDQLAALRQIRRELAPKTVITVGYSGPGLVNTMVAENPDGLVDGAVIGCALNVGLRNLFNVHLDGEHALSVLLLPEAERPRLVNFRNEVEIDTTVAQLRAAVMWAQQSPQGRARIALAAGLGMMPSWFDPANPPPAAEDFDAQELAQYNHYTALSTNGFDSTVVAGGAHRPPGGWPGVVAGGNLAFMNYSRWDIERLAGGNASSNAGVDYARLFKDLPARAEIEALYAEAGLDLGADLERLSEAAHISADPAALEWTAQQASVTGALKIPSLAIRTISDIAGPQYDSWYAARAREAGASEALRQAYVQELGHCNFTPAEVVAAVSTVKARIDTGNWGDTTSPGALQKLAESLDLGPAQFVTFRPGKFVSDRERQP